MHTQHKNRSCKKTSLILTVCFLIALFFICAATLITKAGTLLWSVSDEAAANYLESEQPGFLEKTQARIRSLDNTLSSTLYLSDELGYISSGFQYALGKQVVSIGNASMLRTNEGYLYDITAPFDFSQATGEILAFRSTLDQSTPFLYLHEHALAIGDDDADELSPGYAALDSSFENSDQIVSIMQNAGVPLLDSRSILGNSGYSTQELMLQTDHHWTPLGNLIIARAVAEKLQQLTGAALDVSLLDADRFNTETYSSLLLGQRGQRIGTLNSTLDDITLYYPEYDTYISRCTIESNGEEVYEEGPFKNSVIRWNTMARNAAGYNTTANGAYGFTEPFNLYRNESAPDITLLVIKDSYSGQIASFLSLLFREVVVVDPRKVEYTAPYYVEKYQPDVVLVGFCQQMLIDHKYTLMSEEDLQGL